MEAPPVVVPLAHTTQLALHPGGGNQTSAFARKYALQHPEWRLDEDEEVDWSKCCGLVLDASYSALPNLGPIAAAAPTFTLLTILCLRESGVVDIELLRPCSNLVHLDLSSNEIVHLVGGDFWASFRDLLVLLLHGNKVMEWGAVGGLGKAPKLTYLTLFFNPVCKRKMYRQFTTNCCEFLRGLDLHAVSDEEVVEGSKFFEASRCRACSSALALPQPLFKGLTEVALTPTQQEEQSAKLGSQSSRSTAEARLVGGGHRPCSAPNCDTLVLASVVRRVQLLRKFHARNSPVIIGQRQIRRFLGKRFSDGAAVKIQTRVRTWIVKLRAVAALKDILRDSGELYLVQEMMTPIQLRSLAWFQRRIAGHFRLKVLITCAKTLERFMGKVAKKFSEFVDSIERAQVGGVIVGQDQSGELAAAVAKALVVTTPGLTWVEAAERTAMLVTIVPDCRRLRPSSYIEMPDWPILEQDVDTDGVFVTRSVAGIGSRTGRTDIGPPTLTELTRATPSRPLSGLRDPRPRSPVRHRAGVFGSPRMRECKVSRRHTCARRIHRDAAVAKRRSKLTARVDVHEQLWVFRPLKARMLARVLCTLRNESARKPPVPFILERHLIRCASATRIQAAWRGHVLRWVLLDTLASCIIVARAGVCIQRWWRYQRGLSARLGLCRRLWALASAVSSPTMYIELDVFFTLTRGWRWENDEESLVFTFQDGDRVAVVRNFGESPLSTLDSEANGRSGRGGKGIFIPSCGAARSEKRPAVRELPMWALRSVVRQVSPSEVHHGPALSQVGALLTVGVKAKKVGWPLEAAAASAAEPAEDSSVRDIVTSTTPGQLDRNREIRSESFSPGIGLTSARSQEDVGQTHPFRVQQRRDTAETGPPVDLGAKYGGGVELLELTFSSVREARARAVLLAFSTEEPGVWPNQPVAQLMTLGMLRRAAAGEPGQAITTLKAPAQGFRRGDAVEVSVLRLSEGRGGAWFPAIVHGTNVHGSIYNVTLEDGLVEHNVPGSSIRPRDCTGMEPALVEMCHLPSRWQRHARSLFTPADRLELELLRQSLPATTPAEPSPGHRPIQLSSSNPRHEADACVSQFNGLDGRGLVPVGPRPASPGSPLGRAGAQMKGSSPPRWASSQTMSAARAAGGLAAQALEKVARAAAAADEANIASTWVPGNRFRMGLEKLVHLTAHEVQDAAEKVELSARRDNAARARHAEHAEPSPRDRLEKLKAAEVAIFRRESDEINDRAALERAIRDHELKTNAVEARNYVRDSRRLAAEAFEAKVANQMEDTKRRESEVEGERRRNSGKRQADVGDAKARVAQRREGRAKQALRLAESNAFTTSASQLARHVGKHATTLNKAQNARGIRRWVKGQKPTRRTCDGGC